MPKINHLRDKGGARLFHTVAYGLHLVTGHLAKSLVIGASPTHVIKLQQMLGRGPWDGCEGLWWNGLNISSSSYTFKPGTQSTGMADATQGQSTIFTTDVPHSGIAHIEVSLPSGTGQVDNKANPPEGLAGIFRTMKIADYNSSGSQTAFSYSASPAREVADLIIRLGRRPSSRIDWAAWCDWRDYLATSISHDYTALPIDGVGLTAAYYNGTNFTTLVGERIDPEVYFVSSSGSGMIGQNTDNFSIRWEGKIKAKYTETYTFYVDHDNGAKLWVNGTVLVDQFATDGSTAAGTHSGTIALTAGQLYDIKLEVNDGIGNAQFILKWSSASQAQETIPHRYLYPKTQNLPRYETHPFFPAPTRLDDAVRTILNLCNSTVQEVNGKLRFFCLEQLTAPSFSLTDAKVVDGTMKVVTRNPLSLRNSWSARFRDLNSQYLEVPVDPLVIERPDLIALAGRKIDGEPIDLYNTNAHQAYRTLDNLVKRVVDSKFRIECTGTADTYQVLAGDRVTADVEFRDWINKAMLVLESNDSSSEETADERQLIMQEWPVFT